MTLKVQLIQYQDVHTAYVMCSTSLGLCYLVTSKDNYRHILAEKKTDARDDLL